MLKLFQSNGLRFYDTIDTTPNYRQRSYANQNVAARAKACFYQPIDFTDISRVQAWSDSQVTLRIYNYSNAILYTLVVPLSHTMDSIGIYNATIDWATIIGLSKGSYVTITNATGELWKSEPLVNILDEHQGDGYLKIIYSNRKDNLYYGSYRKCFEQILYIPAVLWEFDRKETDINYVDSSLRKKVLKHDFINICKLHTDPMPYFLHDMLRDALNHDTILIENEVWQKHEEGYKISHQQNATIHTAECDLREAGTAIKRIVSQRNNYLALPPSLLPETNIMANSFTINWESNDADSYDVQLSTTPDFSIMVVSVNTTSTNHQFTSLSSCTKYYYRVRAITCAGVSAWVNNEMRHQISLHFRGANKTQVIEMTEKVTDLQVFNIFNNAANIRYKYAPTHGVFSWGIYPYLTLSQVQTQITVGTAIYSLYYEIDTYVIGSDAGLVIDYIAETFWINVGCLSYFFDSNSADLVLYFNKKVALDSLTSNNTADYQFVFTNSASTPFVLNAANVAILNSLIASSSGNYCVLIACRYFNNSSNLLSINIRYV